MRGLGLPAILTFVMLGTTLALGYWQVERLAWKRGILAEIDAGEHAAPVRLTGEPRAFQRVIAEGAFLPGTVRYGAEVRFVAPGAAMGSHVLQALAVNNSAPIIVDRGWAVSGNEPPAQAGVVSVQGYIRAPEHMGLFGPSDDLIGRQFFTLDPSAIGRALGLQHVAPFTLVALGAGLGPPEPAHQLPRPPNDHLSYAVTWFSLSAALVVVFAVYVGQVLRRHRAVGGLPE